MQAAYRERFNHKLEHRTPVSVPYIYLYLNNINYSRKCDMEETKGKIKINGYIETNLTHEEWHDQFAQWLKSCNESFKDSTKNGIKGCVSSKRKSMFTEEHAHKQLSNGICKKRITRVDFRTEHENTVILLARLARAVL